MEQVKTEIMLEILAGIQPLQAECLKRGYSMHVDANIHDNFWGEGTHISFDVAIYSGHSLIKSFEFTALDTEAVNRAKVHLLDAYIKTL